MTIKLYRTIHRDKATDINDATQLAVGYFAEHGWLDVTLEAGEVSDLGHYNLKLAAKGKAETDGDAPQPVIKYESHDTETLTCQNCGTNFERVITRGRKPKFCGACAGRAAAEAIIEFKVGSPPDEETAELDFTATDIPAYEELTPVKPVKKFTCMKCWNVVTKPHKC